MSLVLTNPAQAQALEEAEQILAVALEFLEFLGLDPFKSGQESDANVNDGFLGGTGSATVPEQTTGEMGYPDVVAAREAFQLQLNEALPPTIYGMNPAIAAAIGAETVLLDFLEDVINEPLTLEAQEQRQLLRQEHLAYLEDTLLSSKTTSQLSFDLAGLAFELDTRTPVGQLQTISDSAQTASATQDVLKYVASALPIIGEQSSQTTEVLQLMSNQLSLLNESNYYSLASLFSTQTNLESMLEEQRLDRAIQNQFHIQAARERANADFARQVRNRMDAINSFEQLGVIGYSIGRPEQ